MSDAAVTAAITPLRTQFAGSLLERGQDSYDDARAIFNAMIDKRPAVIARCANTTDVVAALGFARANGFEVAVRSGGHSVAGTGLTDSGLVIDLGAMNTVEVDADARIARVAGGATWADVDRACQPHGLARPAGGSRPPAWPGSRSAAATAGCPARSGWPATTWHRWSWSPLTDTSSPPRRTTSPSCFGRCTAVAGTLASPRRSLSGCTPCRSRPWDC